MNTKKALKDALYSIARVISPRLVKVIIYLRNIGVVNDLLKKQANAYTYTCNYPTFGEKRSIIYSIIAKNDYYYILKMKRQNNNKMRINPVKIIQFGLSEYNTFNVSRIIRSKNNAIRIADYLMDYMKDGVLQYNFDYPIYGTNYKINAPWGSAMAQGQVLSLFARINYITKNPKYIIAGKKVLETLDKKIEDGGFKTYFNGHPFYEEYPTKYPFYTLNGFMFCLIGLFDFYSCTKYSLSLKLFEDGIKTLKMILPYYDTTMFSLYDLGHIVQYKRKPLVNEKYHIIHINQLIVINSIEPSDIFKYFINKWSTFF